MTRKAKTIWIAAVLLLAGAGTLFAVYISAKPFEMTTTDTAWAEYFRQGRLRRGADQQLFDLTGKSVGIADFPAGHNVDNSGGPGRNQRQLIIDLPADDTLRMDRYLMAYCGRSDRVGVATGYLVEFVRRKEGWRAVYDVSIPSSYSRKYLLFHMDSKVRQMDLVVKYWRGPMGKAVMTFDGPFEAGKSVAARELPAMKVTAATMGTEGVLKIEGSTYFHWSQVNGYDAKGRRYDADLLHGNPQYYPGDFLEFHGVKLGDLVAVTCTEEANEVVFNNVPLELPAQP